MQPTMMTYISEEPACLAQILRDYRQKLAAIETFAEALFKEIARAQRSVQRRSGRQQQNSAYRVLAGKLVGILGSWIGLF
jgi:hypothetical protein